MRSSDGRIAVIDAFRGVAILAVILYHYTYRWGPLQEPSGPDLYGYPVNVGWFQYGWLGVYFFFIISGFVIFMTLERSASWRDFAFRRFLRLYPSYFVCMTITFITTATIGVDAFVTGPREYLFGLTMQSMNFGVGWVDGAYWSLLVELKFYFWVCILYFAAKRYFVPMWSALMIAIAVIHAIGFNERLFNGVFSSVNTPFFTLGMAFYLIYRKERFTPESAILIGTAGVGYLLGWHDRPIGVHLIVVCMIALFAMFLTGYANWIRQGWIVALGTISYPLYLLHQAIGVSLLASVPDKSFVAEIAAIVLVSLLMVAMARIVHRYVEVPVHAFARARVIRAASTF